jgi:hypothetical protein
MHNVYTAEEDCAALLAKQLACVEELRLKEETLVSPSACGFKLLVSVALSC